MMKYIILINLSREEIDLIKSIESKFQQGESDIHYIVQSTESVRSNTDESDTKLPDKSIKTSDASSDVSTNCNLNNKSIEELKDMYKDLYGTRPRGKSASKEEWLVKKIREKSKDTQDIENSKMSTSSTLELDTNQIKDNFEITKSNSLSDSDSDNEFIIHAGTKYELYDIGDHETWMLNQDGEKIGSYNRITKEINYDKRD